MTDSENKSEDVVMADAAQPAAEEAPKKKAAAAGKAPRFEIKKWNAVVSIYQLVIFCYDVIFFKTRLLVGEVAAVITDTSLRLVSRYNLPT
eukprot:scaffold26643_cov150-Skeletonema_menzelii.AAC.1